MLKNHQGKVKEGGVELEHARSKEQIIDMLTKPLSTTTFQEFRKLFMMKKEKFKLTGEFC